MDKRRGKLRNGGGRRADADAPPPAKPATANGEPQAERSNAEARLLSLREQITTDAYEIDFDQLAAKLLASRAWDKQ